MTGNFLQGARGWTVLTGQQRFQHWVHSGGLGTNCSVCVGRRKRGTTRKREIWSQRCHVQLRGDFCSLPRGRRAAARHRTVQRGRRMNEMWEYCSAILSISGPSSLSSEACSSQRGRECRARGLRRALKLIRGLRNRAEGQRREGRSLRQGESG